MRKRSTPSSTSTGQTTSRNAAATISVPSETFGAAFFAPNATAKWPMNISSSSQQRLLQLLLRGLVAEPDPQQRPVEILAGDDLAARLAVQHDSRSRSRDPVERDQVALLRRLDGIHDGGELGEPIGQRLPLHRSGVRVYAHFERIDQLLRAHAAHQAHRDPLGARQSEDIGGARLLLREIESRDVDT